MVKEIFLSPDDNYNADYLKCTKQIIKEISLDIHAKMLSKISPQLRGHVHIPSKKTLCDLPQPITLDRFTMLEVDVGKLQDRIAEADWNSGAQHSGTESGRIYDV